MIPNTDWKPTLKDIKWQRSMIDMLKDRATWGVPGALSAFEIDKTTKKFKLVVGNPDDETNRRIAKVFKRLGFSEDDGNPTSSPRYEPSAN